MQENIDIADALARIHAIARINGANIIRSQQMKRSDRELLNRTGWLREIIKGWYLVAKPGAASGESAIWYSNFWEFLRIYLSHYFGEHYCLSAENSLDLHTGSSTIPKQVVVITEKGSGVTQALPFDTSILCYASPTHIPEETAL